MFKAVITADAAKKLFFKDENKITICLYHIHRDADEMR